VARDRQRAKQRRRKPGTGGPAAGSARTRARDAGLEPTDTRLDDTPPPEPTKHAFPDVEEARMAEAGVPMGEGDFDRGHATADEDADAAPVDPAVVEERTDAARPRPKRGRVLTFLGHVVDELRRVQWPDRRQTGQGTAVTLGFVVIAGGFLGLMDAIWQPLIEALL
jgi:preprotein translocase SecE subunit